MSGYAMEKQQYQFEDEKRVRGRTHTQHKLESGDTVVRSDKFIDCCYERIIVAYHRHSRHCTGSFQGTREDKVDQEQAGEAQPKRILQKMGLSSEKKQLSERQEWCQSVVQCIHLHVKSKSNLARQSSPVVSRPSHSPQLRERALISVPIVLSRCHDIESPPTRNRPPAKCGPI